jgi:hypothetical protein
MPVDSVAPTKPAQVAPAPKTKATTPAPASGGNGETSGTINTSVAIQASKMNVFYIGVDNPVRIAAAGVPANEIAVTMEGNGTITGSNGEYMVRVTQPGQTIVRVSRIVNGQSTTLFDYPYRIKRVPDPTPRLDARQGGRISKGELLKKTEITAMLDNFDFDAVCNVVGYELTILPREQDPVTFNVKGGLIPENARAMLEKLVGDGDSVFFDDIKILCPGDAAPRHVGGLAFKLKPEGQ